jgi:hypothetical protein
MAEISSFGALSNQVTPLPVGPGKLAARSATTGEASSALAEDTQVSPHQAQLSRLNTVLNSLQKNATVTRSQALRAASQIKSGTYQIDSLLVSKSIVGDLLNSKPH